MTQMERLYKISAMSLYKYLLVIQNWVLELIMEHAKNMKKALLSIKIRSQT